MSSTTPMCMSHASIFHSLFPPSGRTEPGRTRDDPSMTMSTVADIIRTFGRERPEDSALEVGDRSISFGELDRRSNQVAAALAADGVGYDDRVAFIDKNGPEWFEVTFATAKLGAVNVSVNWRLAPPEMAQIITDAH